MKMDSNDFCIDFLQNQDLNEIIKTFNFPWTTQEATQSKWETYLIEQKAGKRIVCLVRWQNQLIGYGSLLKDSQYLNFKNNGIPEIHDAWISEAYRGQGFGNQLICYLEELAHKENFKSVGLGVGLYGDYGRAQRLYIKLGYIPDGEGVTYQYKAAVPGNSYPLDDDLIIWLKKELPK